MDSRSDHHLLPPGNFLGGSLAKQPSEAVAAHGTDMEPHLVFGLQGRDLTVSQVMVDSRHGD